MAASGRGFLGPAGRCNRYRINRDPGDPGDRRRGRPSDRVPAHPQLQRAGAKEGAKVVVADILGDRAEAVAASIRASNGAAFAAAIDVTSEPAWVALIAKTVETYGRLDILVNNAGISGSSVGD